MKPKDLKSPCSWEERRPVIYEGIFFVPHHYDRHHEWAFPGWESPGVFGRRAPIEIEYCSGNGPWILEKAHAHPERNWVAVERQFDRVRKIWAKMRNQGVANLFIVCGEALTFTRFYVPDESFQGIYINFPDPWPKEKHAKNRLLQEPFISEMARVSASHAQAIIATDHALYASQIIENMHAHPAWTSAFDYPHFVTEWENYGSSYFRDLWNAQGVQIQYMKFLRGERQ